MKKIFFGLFALLAGLFLFSSQAFAQTATLRISPHAGDNTTIFHYSITDFADEDGSLRSGTVYLQIVDNGVRIAPDMQINVVNGNADGPLPENILSALRGEVGGKTYQAQLFLIEQGGVNIHLASAAFELQPIGVVGELCGEYQGSCCQKGDVFFCLTTNLTPEVPPGGGSCTCVDEEYEKYLEESGGGATCQLSGGAKGINTAIGCIPFQDPNAFIGFFLKWAIGIGGGIAFLLILYAGFTIMTSSGNPDRLKSGQQLLTSAVAGLIMLIFSIFILRIIGVDILKIPGFGG